MDNKFKKIILLIGDIVILYFSLYITLFLRYLEQPSIDVWQKHSVIFSIAFIFWIIIFYIFDLYNIHYATNNSKFFNISIKSISIAGLLTSAIFYINPQIGIAPKTNLVIYIFVFFVLFIIWRRFFNWSINVYLPKNNIVIIGFNKQVRELIKTLYQKPHLGYCAKFIVTDNKIDNLFDIKIINNIHKLKQLVIDEKINTIVLVSDPHQSKKLRVSLFYCLPLKINIINLINFYEDITGKIPIDSISQMWFLENLSEGRKKLFDIIKRIYDIILSIIIIMITIIFWPIIGLIIKTESKGPIFFYQIRSGKNNKQFKLIKFRTMRQENNNFSPTVKNDARITKFGLFLRKSRIDEIPQVLNILIGDMSFVGPRPERPELIEKLKKQILFYRERMLVKPGLTGWDQVSGEYHSPSYEDTLKKMQFDLFYIKNRSIYLDLSILLKTIATVFRNYGR